MSMNKFRAWDVKERCWIPEELFAITSKGGLLTYDADSDRWLEDEIEFELVRFTGLCDRDGVALYEGDIITECIIGDVIWEGKGIIREVPVGSIYYHNELALFNVSRIKQGLVELADGHCELWMSHYDGLYEWCRMRDDNTIKRIGNIYENPELKFERL